MEQVDGAGHSYSRNCFLDRRPRTLVKAPLHRRGCNVLTAFPRAVLSGVASCQSTAVALQLQSAELENAVARCPTGSVGC